MVGSHGPVTRATSITRLARRAGYTARRVVPRDHPRGAPDPVVGACRETWKGSRDVVLRSDRAVNRPSARAAITLEGQGHAGGQHRLGMWKHASVCGPRAALAELQGSRLRAPRLSLERLRQTGTGQRGRHQEVLQSEVPRHLPHVREGQDQGRGQVARLPVSDRPSRRAALEFPQIPGRQGRPGHPRVRRQRAAR